MPGITIHDTTLHGRFPAFDVRDLLSIIDDRLSNSRWTIRNLECTGDFADRLHEVADAGHEVSGAELKSLSDRITQTIEGDFHGILEGGGERIVIRAVDASYFDVETTDDELLDRFRRRFAEVTEFPANVTYLRDVP